MVKMIIAVVAIFIVWSGLDFVLHGILLQEAYQATSQIWRPMEEIKSVVLSLVTLITAFAFVFIYARMIAEKSMKSGLLFGAVWGLAAGVSFAYGSYAVMPVPYSMALLWFVGTLVQATAAGALVALIVKE